MNHQHTTRTPATAVARRPAMTVAAALTGLACGAYGTHFSMQWTDRTEIRMVALAGTYWSAAGTTGRAIAYSGEITMINTGREPVTVLAVSGAAQGLQFHGEAGDSPLPPGTAVVLGVSATADCDAAQVTAPIEVAAEIRTVDGRLHDARMPMPYDATPWQDAVYQTCRSW